MGVKELRDMPMEQIAKAAQAQTPVARIMDMVVPKPVLDRTPEFSVITCSIDNTKFEQMEQCYKVALAGEDYEVIRINDAKSLAEGYNRGAAQARGSILIFSHDDAAPIRPVGARIRSHLQSVDIVAGAGSDRLDGPAWFTAGPPHVFGQVLNKVPNSAAMMLTVYGVPAALVKNICVFDGFWFACPQHVWDRELRFDPELCDGFHMYDVDFSFRAYRYGLKIGVATDLSLCHASSGGYGDPKWKLAADKWMAVHGKKLQPHLPRQFQFMGVMGENAQDLLGVMDQFVLRAEGR